MREIAVSIVLLCACAKGEVAKPDGAGSASAAAHAGHGFVAGGVVAKSAKYTLIGTLTAGQGTSSSTHYVQRGGVIGATQP
jgi:hypothetical protein